jgi:hypothetical protein
MNLDEAKAKLNDYLLNGVEAELYYAEESRCIASAIGLHSPRINKTRFAALFGRLQEVFSERETLAISKMFDRPNKRFETRSIPAILDLIEADSAIWVLEDRCRLLNVLQDNGYGDFRNGATKIFRSLW